MSALERVAVTYPQPGQFLTATCAVGQSILPPTGARTTRLGCRRLARRCFTLEAADDAEIALLSRVFRRRRRRCRKTGKIREGAVRCSDDRKYPPGEPAAWQEPFPGNRPAILAGPHGSHVQKPAKTCAGHASARGTVRDSSDCRRIGTVVAASRYRMITDVNISESPRPCPSPEGRGE